VTSGLSDFPFPLTAGTYHYTANLQPGGQRQETEAGSWGETITRVGPDYRDIVAERARILRADPGRLINDPALPAAEWDTLRFLMRHLAAEYPADFRYSEPGGSATGRSATGRSATGRSATGRSATGRQARWENRPLGITADFTPGDPDTLPCGPLEFIGRQVAEDLVLLDEREGHLYADAGLVTFASGWSFPFVAGSSFQEIHGPVPRANADGVFARAEAFLLRLPPGAVYRRLNWGVHPLRVRDHSMDAAAAWMPAVAAFLATATAQDIARDVHLRVELQHLIRLETSGAVLFLIDTRFASLADLAGVPAWSARLQAVLAALPDDVADYKDLRELRPLILDCLRELGHA
jgi:dimethylamine monooxygenase subunit A